jgi:hypothetical protein
VTVTPNTRTTGALARSGGIETIMRLRHFDWQTRSVAMMIDPGAKLLAVLDHAEKYRGLAMRAKDRGEREAYERIVELYVEIAEELERPIDR